MEFELEQEYIELIKLLKILGIAETGGMAKAMVENEEVKCNGLIEIRKRFKLRKGDTVEVDEIKVQIV
ncbi:MAG: RNA-binding S4 domain-containing protein [Vicingaceae bacterium]